MRKLSLLAVAGPVLFTAASLLLESAAAARGGIIPSRDARRKIPRRGPLHRQAISRPGAGRL